LTSRTPFYHPPPSNPASTPAPHLLSLHDALPISAWIALTDSTPDMGCIKILPGTHVIGQRPHKDTSTPGNLLSRGQTIQHRLDRSEEHTSELQSLTNLVCRLLLEQKNTRIP